MPLEQRVLAYIRQLELIQAGDRVGVAVSGGLDSVALLRLLIELRHELGIVLSVVHLNHQLRGEESEGDQQFVAALARKYHLEFYCESADVGKYARDRRLSLEAAGRALRYDYFHTLFGRGVLNRIATAHTQDDQAETVLLRLSRGAGTRGLAGIYPKLSIAPEAAAGPAFVVRPLLATSRKELEVYLSEIRQDWREDSSNRDDRHARNRIRRGLLPWLEQNLNPSIRVRLSESAEVARAEQDYWDSRIAAALPAVFSQKPSRPGGGPDRADRGCEGKIDVAAMQHFPLALQRRIVLAAGIMLNFSMEFHDVEQILALIKDPDARGPWPLSGWSVVKKGGEILFQQRNRIASPVDFEYALPVPGEIVVDETRSEFRATIISAGGGEGYNPHDQGKDPEQDPDGLLNAQFLSQELRVRNWREGDRFWPAHTRAPRKIKELLTERHVTGPDRKAWPVIVSGNEVVWMRGFLPPSHLRLATGPGFGVRIRETPLGHPEL